MPPLHTNEVYIDGVYPLPPQVMCILLFVPITATNNMYFVDGNPLAPPIEVHIAVCIRPLLPQVKCILVCTTTREVHFGVGY